MDSCGIEAAALSDHCRAAEAVQQSQMSRSSAGESGPLGRGSAQTKARRAAPGSGSAIEGPAEEALQGPRRQRMSLVSLGAACEEKRSLGAACEEKRTSEEKRLRRLESSEEEHVACLCEHAQHCRGGGDAERGRQCCRLQL